ncbi:hypothetical protein [Tranquillimonas alkanivorans]|uniref:hypothetical protein n=1 Tax=Tranquillimonas alkanivorans TaxID=441119 RepID=UPI0011604AF5|nr:hypothetical protein [Tranquillimonas alkanivorans]
MDDMIDDVRIIEAVEGIFLWTGTTVEQLEWPFRIAQKLRPGETLYESFESAASGHGFISQIPMIYTLGTTGESGYLKTRYGHVELTHVERSPEEIERMTRPAYGPVRIARPELALDDLRRKDRNLHLVNMEDYEEVVNELVHDQSGGSGN